MGPTSWRCRTATGGPDLQTTNHKPKSKSIVQQTLLIKAALEPYFALPELSLLELREISLPLRLLPHSWSLLALLSPCLQSPPRHMCGPETTGSTILLPVVCTPYICPVIHLEFILIDGDRQLSVSRQAYRNKVSTVPRPKAPVNREDSTHEC